MRQDLTGWRTDLTSSSEQLTAMQAQLAGLTQRLDSATFGSSPGDTALVQTLASIRRKQQRTTLRVQQLLNSKPVVSRERRNFHCLTTAT
jgi:hypothetical protein